MTLREKQKESKAAIHAEQIRSEEKQKESDTKCVACVNQLQADQVKKQKEANDDYMHRIAELNQQHA